jgi:hypothetical protein
MCRVDTISFRPPRDRERLLETPQPDIPPTVSGRLASRSKAALIG